MLSFRVPQVVHFQEAVFKQRLNIVPVDPAVHPEPSPEFVVHFLYYPRSGAGGQEANPEEKAPETPDTLKKLDAAEGRVI